MTSSFVHFQWTVLHFVYASINGFEDYIISVDRSNEILCNETK